LTGKLSAPTDNQIYPVPANHFSPSLSTILIGEWPENHILIPDWTYFHCPGTTLNKYPGDFSKIIGLSLNKCRILQKH